jgi:predicted ATPase
VRSELGKIPGDLSSMKYKESTKDQRLRKWFGNDHSTASLRRIVLKVGQVRGINSLDLSFEYPITAIAGRNGAGKSTILALACCAYHNTKDGFRLPKRQHPYYTFRDFFMQHADEVPLQGIEIYYGIAYNKWKESDRTPGGVGVGYQKRAKKKDGKWSDYADRVKRNVAFLGIERIVPHSERSQSRSYSRVFKDAKAKGWEDKVKDAVGFVLQRAYDKFRYLEYSKYSLPMVKQGQTIYSGFNMGAGENALFEIFSTMYSCGPGSLLVMDEVELGLHAEAQKRFIDRLKDVCLDLRAQVICTTHSREIFESLPPDARFYIEPINGKTTITHSISPEFAFSKLGAAVGTEMDILVEDEVARAMVVAALPSTIRRRVTFRVIGSATALARQLAALYVRQDDKPTLAIFDADQRVKYKDLMSHARGMAEVKDGGFDPWFAKRAAFLPGATWPEAWIVERALLCLDDLAVPLHTDKDTLVDAILAGANAGKHEEFFEMARQLGLTREQCLQTFVTSVCTKNEAEFSELVANVSGQLAH